MRVHTLIYIIFNYDVISMIWISTVAKKLSFVDYLVQKHIQIITMEDAGNQRS